MADVLLERGESVHYQSLGKLVRDQLAKGADLPADVLGIWTGRQAQITVP